MQRVRPLKARSSTIGTAVFGGLVVGIARAYQLLLSPVLPQTCRYHPTCSGYLIEAVQAHGPVRGGIMGLRRIARCHPWGSHGYDPVPERIGPTPERDR